MTDLPMFREWVKLLAKKNVVCFLMGDMCDLRTRYDKRYLDSEVADELRSSGDDLARVQVRMLCKTLAPLLGNIAFVLQGNHERTLGKCGIFDPHSAVCDELNVVQGENDWKKGDTPLNGHASSYIRIQFKRGGSKRTFKLYVHHGYFGGQRPNKMKKLNDLIHLWDADIVLVGHGHDTVTTGPVTRPRPSPTWDRLVMRPGIGIMCPSWKRPLPQSHISWEETRGFVPSVHGPTLLRITPETREIEVFFGKYAFNTLNRASIL